MKIRRLMNAHTEHCCARHGCKYMHGDACPVATGKTWQSHPCEWCESQIKDDWEIAHLENRLHDAEREIAYRDNDLYDARWELQWLLDAVETWIGDTWASSSLEEEIRDSRKLLARLVAQYHHMR
jgi:hypothetical protein